MKRHVDRQALSSLSELNITPLVDLAFVLLIIFMITTPLIERTVDVEIPTSNNAQASVDPDSMRVISIQPGGAMLWQAEPLTVEALPARLTAWKQERGDSAAIVLRADKQVNVEALVTVLDAVKAAGIQRVGIATQPGAQAQAP